VAVLEPIALVAGSRTSSALAEKGRSEKPVKETPRGDAV
jgi:hypothetical protein